MASAIESSDAPFRFTVTGDGRIFIRWSGRVVTVLKGAAAEKFLAASATRDPAGLQLLLARVTGNFKRGNERARGRRG